ncbi:hypothetical protein ES702_03137 [subsurface metagenome]
MRLGQRVSDGLMRAVSSWDERRCLFGAMEDQIDTMSK